MINQIENKVLKAIEDATIKAYGNQKGTAIFTTIYRNLPQHYRSA